MDENKRSLEQHGWPPIILLQLEPISVAAQLATMAPALAIFYKEFTGSKLLTTRAPRIIGIS